MRLTRIDLHGFKSFFHRTSLELPEGISAVVGPNGCGKSNIADAIRWVMGEQSAKNLRGRAMEDVIFAGSSSSRSLGLAEVTLTLERTNGAFPSPYHHHQELTVTRRLYRSGESEYLINRLPCRLKDITHLFMDTGLGNRGYAIIEQGSIGRIVDSRPEDRRAWIEEAAGVVKFKAQRLAANRKMEQTGHNLERVADILSEVQRQAASLQRQAQKARRHRRYTEEARRLELALASSRQVDLNRLLDERESRDRDLTDQRDGLITREAADSAKLSAQRLNLSQAEQELSQRREERANLSSRIMSLEQERVHLQDKVAELGRRREQDRGALAQEEARLAELKKEDEGLADRRQDLASRLEAKQAEENQARERLEEARLKAEALTRDLSGTKDKLIDLASRRAGANNALITARERLGTVQARLDRLSERGRQAREEQAELEESLARAREGLDQAEEDLRELAAEREVIAETQAQAGEEVAAARARFDQASRKAQAAQGELEGLKALAGRLEGVAEGVKHLLRAEGLKKKLGGNPFLGLAAQSIVVPPELERAVEAALAGGTDLLVAAGTEETKAALAHLRRQGAGRANLTALDLISTPDQPGPPPSGAGLLAQELTFTGPAAEIGRALVRDVLLAEDLDSALEIWRADGRRRPVVTRAGELISPPGVVSGGRDEAPGASLLARQRAIRELEEKLAGLKAEAQARADELAAAEQVLVQGREESLLLEERLREAEAARTEAERELSRWTVRLEEVSRLDEVLEAEAQAIEEDRVLQESILQEQTGILARVEAEQGQMDDLLSQAEVQVQEAMDQTAKRQEELTDLRIVVSRLRQETEQQGQEGTRLVQDLRRTETRVEMLVRDIAQAKDSIQRCHDRSAKAEEELKRLTELAGRTDQDLEEEADRLAQAKEALSGQDSALRTLQAEIRGLDEEARQASLALSETRMDLKHLREDILERYQVDLAAEAKRYLEPDLDQAQAREEVAELKRKLEGLGPVNPTAVEEYQALEERREFLEAQVADLTASMDDLKAAIRKINRTTVERFMETFRSVGAKMTELCPILFGEGALAELILVDPEDPLESGVEIKIQPAGKKLVSMGLLSGGEKALTAVTLLFAIFLHRPSPFCLLDEVDAPLDERNVDRFNSLVREIGRHSQILMITHNRRTMEVVDTLYGVTMPEPGVSRLVSVRLDSEAGKIDELVSEE